MNKVIGFDNEFNLILNGLENNSLPNSVLFSGHKGIGKNYFLRKLIEDYIKIQINNSQIQHHLTLFNKNTHPNIRLITKETDEKTKKIKNFITIDQVRKINQFSLETSIIENMPKFILIDSVDEMNLNAANALLKILEEPKVNTFIFLISHQPYSLLPTIKSRCLKINFANHNFENFSYILQFIKSDISEELINFFFDITNGSPGLTNDYQFEEILDLFDKITDSVIDPNPFSQLNNEIINVISSFENEKLKIYLSLFKFILITINKIKIGIDIKDNYLSMNVLKIENIADHISKFSTQRKLDYLINNENDLFTFNLDKKIFMTNFIAEK